MKYTEVKLMPLTADDREQFILDNQRSFKHGALMEFGERDHHIDEDGEIISRKTIEMCMDAEGAETYRIISDGKVVGGVILHIDNQTHNNELDTLFVLPDAHSKGIGYGAWLAVESMHSETVIWRTCTPYFDKRNIHFYVNKCGFQIDEFWCEYFKPSEPILDEAPDEGPDEMFHFIKIMKSQFGGSGMTKDTLEKFFQRYERFFKQSLDGEIDGDEMSELYAPEFIAASPIGVLAGKNDAGFRQTLSGGYEQYRKIGTKGMRIRGVEMSLIDALHCVAHVAWRASYEVANTQQVDIDFDVHYLMQELNGNLRIFGWISGNEQEVLKEYGII